MRSSSAFLIPAFFSARTASLFLTTTISALPRRTFLTAMSWADLTLESWVTTMTGYLFASFATFSTVEIFFVAVLPLDLDLLAHDSLYLALHGLAHRSS